MKIHIVRSLFIILALGLFSIPSIEGAKRNDKIVRIDPLVGAYTLNLTLFGDDGFANMSIQADGTLTCMDSFDIGQGLTDKSNGQAGTTWSGIWKKIGFRKYRVLIINLISLKEECCPTTPFARLKVEGIISLGKNGKLTSKLFASFWDLDDLTLSNGTHTPLVPLPLYGQRVEF